MIGRTIGSYEIVEKIGQGGVGEVFRAVDVMLDREVAIKLLRPELAARPDVIERFRSEARLLAKLNHPNVATLYSLLAEEELLAMVMELVPGQTLTASMRASGPMPLPSALQVFFQALDGIGAAHALGIIHRDIKSSNLMFSGSGVVKVMDFGVARGLGSDRLTRSGLMVGTPQYMPPEQIRGRDTDVRSDIYALGCLLYEMLTGRAPFGSESEYDLLRAQVEQSPAPLIDFAPEIPIPIERAVLRSLEKQPERRFPSTQAFREALEASIPAELRLVASVVLEEATLADDDGCLATDLTVVARQSPTGVTDSTQCAQLDEADTLPAACEAPQEPRLLQPPAVEQLADAQRLRARGLVAVLAAVLAIGAGVLLLRFRPTPPVQPPPRAALTSIDLSVPAVPIETPSAAESLSREPNFPPPAPAERKTTAQLDDTGSETREAPAQPERKAEPARRKPDRGSQKWVIRRR